MIYHYTSLEIFLKMVDCIDTKDKQSTFTFWASNAYCMNDPSEMQIGYDFLRSYINGADPILSEKEKLLSLMPESSNNMFNPDSSEYFLGKENNPFVVSFSNKRDNIPMWSLYGNNGYGVCLGFDEERIKKNGKKLPDIYLQPVAYHQNDNETATPELKLLADTICKNLQDYCLQIDSINNKDNVITLKKTFLKRLCPFISAYIKVSDYCNEQEVRLMSICDLENSRVHYRFSMAHNVIPYIEVKIPVDSLGVIILGSNANSQLNKFFVETALKQKGITPDILYSEAQFRTY